MRFQCIIPLKRRRRNRSIQGCCFRLFTSSREHNCKRLPLIVYFRTGKPASKRPAAPLAAQHAHRAGAAPPQAPRGSRRAGRAHPGTQQDISSQSCYRSVAHRTRTNSSDTLLRTDRTPPCLAHSSLPLVTHAARRRAGTRPAKRYPGSPRPWRRVPERRSSRRRRPALWCGRWRRG